MGTFLQRLSRGLSSKKIPIIMIHGVFDLNPAEMDNWNPSGKHLHIAQFSNTLSKITEEYKPISLTDILDHQQNQTWPDKPSFALTFDDGYAGFEKLILPLLERFDCPASFFPVIDFLDGHMLWMDQVEAVILTSDNFVSPQGDLLPPAEALPLWRSHLKTMNNKARKELLEKYFQLPDTHERASQHQAVSWDELNRLYDHPLVSIGNHTLSHPIIAKENKENMSGEIVGAAERLRHELGECDLFCYPNGGPDDHNEESYQIVKESHHRCALLTSEALVSSDTDPFLWPRFSLSANTYDTPWFWNGIYGLRDLKKKFIK